MATLALVAVALIIGQLAVGAECITIGPAKPAKPILRVRGAFCGTLFYQEGLLKNSELDLVDQKSLVIVATTRVDSKGTFKFSSLPIGKYRAYLPGFTTTEAIDITSSDQRNCVVPLFVKLIVAGECAPPGHISRVPTRN